MNKFLAVAIFIFILAGCATPPSGSGGYSLDPDTLGTQGARAVDDSSATRIALTRVSAMATVEQQKRDADETAVAQSIMNATAQANLATRDHLDNENRQMEIQATGTALANASGFSATATAMYLNDLERELQLQAQLEQEEIQALATQRAADAKRDQVVSTAINVTTVIGAILAVVGIGVGTAYLAVLVYGKWKEKSAPIIQVMVDDTTQMFRRINGNVEPVGPNRLTGATTAQLTLPSEAGQILPAKWESFTAWQDYSRGLPIGAIINDYDGRRRPMLINPVTEAFLLIAGKNGSGKSIGGLMPYILAMWASGAHVVIINGRGSDFQSIQNLPNITFFPYFENTGDLLEPLAAFLVYLQREARRRDQVLARYGVPDWRALPPDANEGGPILIAIDELLDIVTSIDVQKRKVKAMHHLSKRERQAQIDRLDYIASLVWSGLNGIASVSRKHAIHIVATLTDPTEKQLGADGMHLRSQSAAIAFKMKSAAASRTFLNVDGRHDGFPKGSAGLPTGQFIASIDGQIEKCVAFHPTPNDARHFSNVKLPGIRPFVLPSDLDEGIKNPTALAVGNPGRPQSGNDGNIVTGEFTENQPTNDQVLEDAQILQNTNQVYQSPTAAAGIIFRERGELSSDVAPAGWMIERAKSALFYLSARGDDTARKIISRS